MGAGARSPVVQAGSPVGRRCGARTYSPRWKSVKRPVDRDRSAWCAAAPPVASRPASELLDQLLDRRRALGERGLLVGSQLDLEDPLQTASAQHHRDADEQVAGPELALEEHGA